MKFRKGLVGIVFGFSLNGCGTSVEFDEICPETSSICVCAISLLEFVSKQTQISCAQEPQHAATLLVGS